MGAPWLKARGLSCESPAGHKLHLVCGTGRQPTLGRTLGLTQAIFHWEHRGVRPQLGPRAEEGLPSSFR